MAIKLNKNESYDMRLGPIAYIIIGYETQRYYDRAERSVDVHKQRSVMLMV